MAITTVEKIKINKYLKEHTLSEANYFEMCDILNRRGKVSEVEFLEFFTNSVVDAFHKEEKISTNHLTKLILLSGVFLDIAHGNDVEVKEEILDKVRSFGDFYEDYLSRNGLEEDVEFRNNSIEEVLKTINELYPTEVEAANESLIKYIERIEELERNIQSLTKELNGITSQYEKMRKSYERKSNSVSSLKEKISKLKDEVESKNNKISQLEKSLETLNSRISELESSLSASQEENDALLSYKERYETLTDEVGQLKQKIKSDNLEKENENRLREKQAKIEKLLYQKLLFERLDIDEILSYLQKEGFVSGKEEVIGLLKRIKTKIHIASPFFSLTPTYKVSSPGILDDENFSIHIPKGCSHYDIMLVSDFHIKHFDSTIEKRFDKLNDYCVKHDIHLVLNLGDFYHGFCGEPLSFDRAVDGYKLVEQSISSIPKVAGLYHAILGGNHDKSFLKYGFDPIAFLANEREDFIHLGYTHSTIELNGTKDILGKFDIHHPDDRICSTSKVNKNEINMEGTNYYLDNLYSKQDRNRDDSYIDIFGHFHRIQFNYVGSYCYIPAFKDGANHLRVYFDEDSEIKYMVFMPLSVGKELAKNNEIVYQKIKGK